MLIDINAAGCMPDATNLFFMIGAKFAKGVNYLYHILKPLCEFLLILGQIQKYLVHQLFSCEVFDK
jgi:hypothetical protein